MSLTPFLLRKKSAFCRVKVGFWFTFELFIRWIDGCENYVKSKDSTQTSNFLLVLTFGKLVQQKLKLEKNEEILFHFSSPAHIEWVSKQELGKPL